MIRAYILVIVEQGIGSKIAAELIKEKEVKDVEIVYGEYDMVVKVELPSMDALKEFITRMRHHKDIKRTATMIAV